MSDKRFHVQMVGVTDLVGRSGAEVGFFRRDFSHLEDKTRSRWYGNVTQPSWKRIQAVLNGLSYMQRGNLVVHDKGWAYFPAIDWADLKAPQPIPQNRWS